jgi:hypothetical protein
MMASDTSDLRSRLASRRACSRTASASSHAPSASLSCSPPRSCLMRARRVADLLQRSEAGHGDYVAKGKSMCSCLPGANCAGCSCCHRLAVA